jgi:hypothetical protein
MESTIFRLKSKKNPLSYTITAGYNGRITTIDKAGNKRAIRHVPSESTIFIDEQSTFAPKNTESPVFKNGILQVPNTAKSTLEYLRALYLNGILYEEINPSKVAKESIERDEQVTELKYEVKQRGSQPDGKDALQAIACVLTGSYIKTRSLGIEELKKEIYKHIDADPYRFVDEHKNSIMFGAENMKRYIVHYGMNSGHIKVSENKKSWIWCVEGSLISNIPNGIMPIDHFCEFLDTDEGMIVMRKLHDMTGDVVGSKEFKEANPVVKKGPGRPFKKD